MPRTRSLKSYGYHFEDPSEPEPDRSAFWWFVPLAGIAAFIGSFFGNFYGNVDDSH